MQELRFHSIKNVNVLSRRVMWLDLDFESMALAAQDVMPIFREMT